MTPASPALERVTIPMLSTRRRLVRPSCVVNSIQSAAGSSIGLPLARCAPQAVAGLGPRRTRRGYEQRFRGDTLTITPSSPRSNSDTREVGAAADGSYWIWCTVTRRRRPRRVARGTRGRRDQEGHQVRERRLPDESTRPLEPPPHVTLVDGPQERADDGRDHEGASAWEGGTAQRQHLTTWP